MDLYLETIEKLLPYIIPVLTGIGGWFLNELKNYREKKRSYNQLKSHLLDEVLKKCRLLESKLKEFKPALHGYIGYLELEESVDPETGYPQSIFDTESEDQYIDYANEVYKENEELRHLHQDYIIKTKSDNLEIIDAIYEDVYKLSILHEDNGEWDYSKANLKFTEALTNLRMVYHYIKEVYPNEVTLKG